MQRFFQTLPRRVFFRRCHAAFFQTEVSETGTYTFLLPLVTVSY
jgi:hypothetical protein